AKIMEEAPKLTAIERKLANAILADYPFTGLQTMQELADRTGVSAPSITRFVSKVGCGGYQDFQRQLIGELKESRRSPLELKTVASPAGEGDFLKDYADRLGHLMKEMTDSVTSTQFD